MRTALLCVLITSLFATNCLTTAQAQGFTTFGGSDCAQWLKNHAQRDKAWVLGFLSGWNGAWLMAQKEKEDPLRKLNSADQAFLWLDNYCKANPLNHLSEATQALYLELRRK